MRLDFLEALETALETPGFLALEELNYNFLTKIKGFYGLILRAYSGSVLSPWKLLYESDQFENEKAVTEFLDLSLNMGINEDNEGDFFCRNKKTGHVFFISPYMRKNYHLGEIILIIDGSCENYLEWQRFADHLGRIIFSNYDFPASLTPETRKESEKALSFIRNIQLLLNHSRNIDALPPGNEQYQGKKWHQEDSSYMLKFLDKFQTEFDLHSVFTIQKSAPGYMNLFISSSISEEEVVPEEVREMIDITLSHEGNLKNTILNETLIKSGKKGFSTESLEPLVFSCQAGGEAFGHLGFFSHANHPLRHIHHQSKLLPMLANHLGFYFSHFFQLRKEAINGRMLQQINQTCNLVNSSVDIGAIVFSLAESLKTLFGQKSGAILIYSNDDNSLEVTNYLEGDIPEGFNVSHEAANNQHIIDAISDGTVFDNSDKQFNFPVRYVLPLAFTPQAAVLGADCCAKRALGGVILFESELNKPLTSDGKDKLIQILLNGISASLQMAFNYHEKIETIRALEGLMERLSNTDALLDEMILIIRHLLKVNRISFLTLDEKGENLFIKKGFGLPPGILEKTSIPIGEEISGFVAQQGRSYRLDNIESEGFFKKRSQEQYLNRSLLSVPLISKGSGNKKSVIGVINVNNKTNGLTFTAQDQTLLESIAHLVVTAMENVRLMEKEHEKKLLDRQLQDAKDIQMSLLPKSFSGLPPTLEVYGISIPARQIGGDFFDILPLDSGEILIALGDVSGKGMPAAILMAVSRMILRSVVQDTTCPIAILEKVNEKLSKELDDYHFVTLQIVAINPQTGEAKMASAGHGPLMARLSGEIAALETKGGPPLGIPSLPGMYDEKKFKMTGDDVILLYTDGLSEEHSKTGEMFGNDRIAKILLSHTQSDSKELVETLTSAAINWRAGKEAHDDLTVLTLKFKGN